MKDEWETSWEAALQIWCTARKRNTIHTYWHTPSDQLSHYTASHRQSANQSINQHRMVPMIPPDAIDDLSADGLDDP